jgi:glyoxylase-like metal-dependent hydrolase (beta-lactamase superfamily II)
MYQAAPGVHCHRTLIANLFFVGTRVDGWVLVDAGVPGSASSIRRASARLFGAGSRPAAIILTHGHFDHVGALPELADDWGVPVYVHPLELPYVNGHSAYPPPDPTVGGGLMTLLSPLYPRGPADLGRRVHLLPSDGAVPHLPGWRWVHTPGHTAGHISLFRDADRTLIAGDAVVTTRQESLIGAVSQFELVWRPPAYYTSDWNMARTSVERLASLEPEVLATGHGHALRGPTMRRALHALAENFDRVRPQHGRYSAQPAVADERGVIHVPQPPRVQTAALALAAAAVAAGAYALSRRSIRLPGSRVES